jgi:pathogenesis-related protein 1
MSSNAMPLRPSLLALSLVACKPLGTSDAAAPTTAQTSTSTPASHPAVGEVGELVGLSAAHNRERAKVGVGALAWSDEIARWADAWARHLAENGCELAHRPATEDNYGENIFWSSGTSTATDVVATWAAEQSGYDHRTNRCRGSCGHFTQLVWRATKTLGCGMSSCPGGGEIWVCDYDPPGNVVGESPY